jgi:hypothetical protein
MLTVDWFRDYFAGQLNIWWSLASFITRIIFFLAPIHKNNLTDG